MQVLYPGNHLSPQSAAQLQVMYAELRAALGFEEVFPLDPSDALQSMLATLDLWRLCHSHSDAIVRTAATGQPSKALLSLVQLLEQEKGGSELMPFSKLASIFT